MGAFTFDMGPCKTDVPGYKKYREKWTMPLANWSITVSQLSIIFGDSLKL
jgi:hypothetical protein